jgi:hypothetical protein
VSITALTAGSEGTLTLDFDLTQGSAGVFTLEGADNPVGPWNPLSVPLTTNSPTKFTFKPIVPGSSPESFYRVRVQ